MAERSERTRTFPTRPGWHNWLGRAPKDQLVNPDDPKKKEGMSAEDIARMENEMESLERDLKSVTDNYTENMFTMTTAHTYIKNLLKNAKVIRYLNANHAEIYAEFETIATTETV
jgi:RepB plasmid partitioning protein